MLKFIIVFVFSVSLYSIEIEVLKDNKINISSDEINLFIQQNLKMKRIRYDKKYAKQIIKDNRLFANAFIDDFGITDKTSMELKLSFEEYLTKQYIQHTLEDIEINDNVIESYYLDNKEMFVLPATISMTSYRFKTYEQAFKFYDRFKNNFDQVDEYAKDNNITIARRIAPIIALDKNLQGMIHDKNKSNYFLPPQFFLSYYSVIYLNKITPSGVKSLDNSVEEIKTLLYKEMFSDTKRKILDKMK